MRTLATFSVRNRIVYMDEKPLPILSDIWYGVRITGFVNDKLLIFKKFGDEIKRFGFVVPTGNAFPADQVFFNEGCVNTFSLESDGVKFTVDAGGGET